MTGRRSDSAKPSRSRQRRDDAEMAPSTPRAPASKRSSQRSPKDPGGPSASSSLGSPASISAGGGPTPQFSRSISEIVKQAFARNRRDHHALPVADATTGDQPRKPVFRYRIPGLRRGTYRTVEIDRESPALAALAEFGDELSASQAKARRIERAVDELARLELEIAKLRRSIEDKTARRDELAANLPDTRPRPLSQTRWARQVADAVGAAITAEPDLAGILGVEP